MEMIFLECLIYITLVIVITYVEKAQGLIYRQYLEGFDLNGYSEEALFYGLALHRLGRICSSPDI